VKNRSRDESEDSSEGRRGRAHSAHSSSSSSSHRQQRLPKPLERRDTFTLDSGGGFGGGGFDDDVVIKAQQRLTNSQFKPKEDLLSGTIHASGIRAILERANQRFVFPQEVRKSDFIPSFKLICF